ncbi:MAG: hypothetical protein AAF604_06745 [Acidobacteriota bacterium]
MIRQLFRLTILFLFLSLSAEARWLETVPVELSPADREEILAVLDLTLQEVRFLRGFGVPNAEGVVDRPAATVSRRVAAPALRVEAGREIPCWQKAGAWTCKPGEAVDMLYVQVPTDCPVRDALLRSGRVELRILRSQARSASEALSVVEFACHSSLLAKEAWSAGHRLQSIGGDGDGRFRLDTSLPEEFESGSSFHLEQHCDVDGVCRWYLQKIGSWHT